MGKKNLHRTCGKTFTEETFLKAETGKMGWYSLIIVTPAHCILCYKSRAPIFLLV